MRKSVVLTSRVHPGESNSSFMMQGVIDFLVSDEETARWLRETFVFKIVPMQNPDGVIVGNYRCSLEGTDLNRQWASASKQFQQQYPVNFHTKQMLRRTLDSREVFLYCDMHGHSTHRNFFMFGNNLAANQNKEKLFPL